MRLQLIRHAQSTANVRKAINTKPPGAPLSELGREQAEALARTLRDEPIVAVYASLAARAQQTAAPVAQAHGLDMQIIDGVQEVFVGALEDRTDTEAAERYWSVYGPWTGGELHPAMPGGENGYEVRDRFLAAVAELRAKHEQESPEGTVVLVSHGGIMRLGAELLADNVSPSAPVSFLIANTAAIVLETAPGGRWRCLSWEGVTL